MKRCVLSYLLLAVVVLASLSSCDSTSGGDTADPNKPGVAIRMAPADAVMNGQFMLVVSVNDSHGTVSASDDNTSISLKLASGSGTLGGTLQKKVQGGIAMFSDLTYDKWESIRIDASADSKVSPATTLAFQVRPILRFALAVPVHARSGEDLGTIQVELVDGAETPVVPPDPISIHLSGMGDASLNAPKADATVSSGPVIFEGVSLSGAGRSTLTFSAPGLADLTHGVFVVGDAQGTSNLDSQFLWLSAGRIGLSYNSTLPPASAPFQLVDGELQDGLSIDLSTGAISGTPTESRHARLVFSSSDPAGMVTLWNVDLSVFPQDESSAMSLDDLNHDGPHQVNLTEDQVNVASRGVTEKIRILAPTSGSAVPPGRFPVIVFQHGFAWITTKHPKIYDRYDELLHRWATWGYIVISIDAVDLMFVGNSFTQYTSSTLANWTALSENQRATVDWIIQKSEDSASPFAGHIDTDHILVSGHSRGGGGSLITLNVEPHVMGAILLRGLDPLMDPAGKMTWNKRLPAKPILDNIAENDEDISYPIDDFIFDRHSSLTAAVTILGTIHDGIMENVDALCGGEGGAPVEQDITCEQDWAISNAYTIAFLKYVVEGDLRYAPLVFGVSGLSTGLSPLGTLVRSNRFASPLVVDNFNDADASHNNLGQANTFSGFNLSVDQSEIAAEAASGQWAAIYNHADLSFSSAHSLSWMSPGAVFRTELGDLNVDGRGSLVITARDDLYTLAAGDIILKVFDSTGISATVDLENDVGKNGIGPRMSDIIVPVSEISAGGLDILHLAAIELSFQPGMGGITITGIRFE